MKILESWPPSSKVGWAPHTGNTFTVTVETVCLLHPHPEARSQSHTVGSFRWGTAKHQEEAGMSTGRGR